jgi:hypothetical protein
MKGDVKDILLLSRNSEEVVSVPGFPRPWRSRSRRSSCVKALPLFVKGSVRSALPFSDTAMYFCPVARSISRLILIAVFLGPLHEASER